MAHPVRPLDGGVSARVLALFDEFRARVASELARGDVDALEGLAATLTVEDEHVCVKVGMTGEFAHVFPKARLQSMTRPELLAFLRTQDATKIWMDPDDAAATVHVITGPAGASGPPAAAHETAPENFQDLTSTIADAAKSVVRAGSTIFIHVAWPSGKRSLQHPAMC